MGSVGAAVDSGLHGDFMGTAESSGFCQGCRERGYIGTAVDRGFLVRTRMLMEFCTLRSSATLPPDLTFNGFMIDENCLIYFLQEFKYICF